MTAPVPDEVRRLAEERQAARAAKDFGSADALRERIRAAGFEVVDGPGGFELNASTPTTSAPSVQHPSEIVSVLTDSASVDASVHWLVEGWPDDVVRGIGSFRWNEGDTSVQHVVVDVADVDPSIWADDVELIRLPKGTGWAVARNAGLVRSAGRAVMVVDGSIEATGDVLGPLMAALGAATVGVTGPFGIVTDDLHEFRESAGPDVDAVEGYLMAFRRTLLEDGVRFDQKFRFYRTADIELSFQIKSRGLRATVTDVPVIRHEHRMWTSTPEDRRDALSKRNFYRFLDTWRGRTDLTVAGASG